MLDRSASDRSQSWGLGDAGPADRLSLAASALLMGGIRLASLAIYQDAQVPQLKPHIAIQAPLKIPARPVGVAGVAIELPPPPPPLPRSGRRCDSVAKTDPAETRETGGEKITKCRPAETGCSRQFDLKSCTKQSAAYQAAYQAP